MSAPAAFSASAGSKRSSSAFGAAAAVPRNVRPLHFHAGPNPTAAVLAEAAAEAAAQSALLPRVHLYRHALECVFGFLRLQDLHAVLSVSHSWKATVKSMSTLCEAVDVSPDNEGSLLRVAISSLARHVGTMGSNVHHCAELFVVSERMTNLRQWNLALAVPLRLPLRFPPSLVVINMFLVHAFATAAINDLLAALAPLRALASLEIIFQQPCEPGFDFTPLQRIPALRELTFRFAGDHMTDAQVDQIRGLTQLHTISLTQFAALPRVLRAPHALPWTTLGRGNVIHITDDVCAVLPSLPQLTAMNCLLRTVTDLDCFQSLRALRTLWIGGFGLHDETPVEVLVQGLKYVAASLTDLQIAGSVGITNEHLAAITAPMRGLEVLSLSQCRALAGLGFLTAAGSTLSSTLQSFHLRQCPLVRSEELIHVHAMRKLRSLSLQPPHQLDPLCLALYRQRPCALIPTLEVFWYQVMPMDD